jgi:hypothetical protein
MPANTTIQFRRGPSSEWLDNDPILASGEPGHDISENLFKIGDGVHSWSELPVLAHGSSGVYNYSTKWLNNYALTTGIIYDNGSQVGILTANPTYTLDINGSFKSNSINVNNAYTLPSGDGLAEQVLQTDGNGSVEWVSIAGLGGGTPISVTGSTQLNSANFLGAGSVSVILDGTDIKISGSDANNAVLSVRGYEVLSDSKNVFELEQNYVSGSLDVYQNGIKLLINDDYIANGGSSFTLNNTAISGDTIEWIAGYAGSSSYSPITNIGSGSINYLSKWDSSNTLTSGIIYDDGQNIGIGLSSPQYRLDVAGTGRFDGLIINNAYSLPNTDGSPNQYLKTDGSGNLIWSTVSGVGSSSSATEISVTGSVVVPYLNITGVGLVSVGLNGDILEISGAGSQAIKGYEIVSVSKNTFDIGGTYSSGNLDVYYNGFKLLINDDYTANGGSSFSLASAAVSGDIVEWIAGYSGSNFVQSINGSGSSNFVAKWANNTTLTSGILYDNGSNIGIGTSSPSTKLHVVGDCRFDGDIVVSSISEKLHNNGNSGASQTISLDDGAIQAYTLTDNCTFIMPAVSIGQSFKLFLNTGAGNFSASFSGILWYNSTPPTITTAASKVDILTFISDGAYWYGSYDQNYG